ncbi:hypothetical protein BC829DRAFT_427688 [Chytridium lagenaria]|nr:hypothetical protein BC829DRAFT_427688 [Chytridium lagenaria]
MLTMLKNILVVGGSGGLGLALTRHLSKLTNVHTFVTSRKVSSDIEALGSTVTLIKGVDVTDEDAGKKIASAVPADLTFDEVFMVAGYFSTETFEKLDWNEQRRMFDICAIGPLFAVQSLVMNGKIREGSKVVLITSEGGSLTLRTHEEGGGNYGHHMSKAAQNMMGKVLAIDLKPKGIPVIMIHPGFLKTEMTKGVGFDQYYEAGGAVEPEDAIEPLLNVVKDLTLETTGRLSRRSVQKVLEMRTLLEKSAHCPRLLSCRGRKQPANSHQAHLCHHPRHSFAYILLPFLCKKI